MDSSNYMTCSLKVNTHTEGWQKSLVKVFQNIQSISYSIDAQRGIVQISGNIDPNKILTLLAKAGKHAELCRIDSGYQKRDPIVPGNGAKKKGHDYAYNPQYGTLDYKRDNPQYGTLDYRRLNPQYGTLDYRRDNPPYGTLDYKRDNPSYGTLDYCRDNPQQRNANSHQQHHPHHQHHQHYETPARYLPQPPPLPPPGNLNVVESPCKIM